MPLIHLTTFIEAPRERVFDLCRSVDLHKHSMSAFSEKVVGGTLSGLLSENDTVTWSAKHLYRLRILKIKISGMKRPEYFIDEQEFGSFKKMKHEHYFKPVDNGTIMIDQFHYETPYGSLGKILNTVYLKKYLTMLLLKRNAFIKDAAEGNKWKQYLNP